MRRCILFVLLFGLPVSGDTVFLFNGTTIDGIVQSRHEENIEIRIGDHGRVYIPIEMIQSIEKNDRDGSSEASNISLEKKLTDVNAIKKTEFEKKTEGGSAGDGEAGGTSADEPRKILEFLTKEDVDPELRKKIEEQIASLQRHKSQFRVRAEKKLMDIGKPAVPFLLDVVNHDNPLVRIAVLRIFEKYGNRTVIPAGLQRLEDENKYVREYAVRSLRSITAQKFGYEYDAPDWQRKTKTALWNKWWAGEVEKEKKKQEELEKKAALKEKSEETNEGTASPDPAAVRRKHSTPGAPPVSRSIR